MAPCREQFSRRVTVLLLRKSARAYSGLVPVPGVDFLSVAESDQGLFRTDTGACRDSFWLPGCAVGWLSPAAAGTYKGGLRVRHILRLLPCMTVSRQGALVA